MSKYFYSALRFVIQRAKKLLLESDAGRRLLADTKNVGTFSNLFEHEIMLADDVRLDAYWAAIEKVIEPESVVVDLGTGTGVLGMMAAKRGARKVYAIDHAPIVDVAKVLAEQNDLHNIEFVRTNSRDFDPGEKVDVVIHEQMGEGLFNENMIENLLDLKRRILRPEGILMPARFSLYMEPVELHQDHHVPYIWENEIRGIDYSRLRGHEVLGDSVSLNRQFVEQAAVTRFLCTPEPAMAVDLNEMDDPAEVPLRLDLRKPVTDGGMLDGVCIYFEADFVDGIGLDTSPFSRRTNWSTSVYRLPRVEVKAGDTIDVAVRMPGLVDVDKWTVEVTVH